MQAYLEREHADAREKMEQGVNFQKSMGCQSDTHGENDTAEYLTWLSRITLLYFVH